MSRPGSPEITPVWTGAVRNVEWHWAFYRRVWKANLLSSFVQPMLYLLAIGVGVGTLVDDGDAAARVGGSYLGFLGPGLLATTAMMLAANESLWSLMNSFTWSRAFHAGAATRLGATDLAVGQALWIGLRSAMAATTVALALLAFPETRDPGLVLAVPAAALCGVACGMPISAWTATRTLDTSFSAIQRFVVVPLFLFGGAFYPLSELPVGLQAVGWLTPLWHGVELTRGATTMPISAAAAFGHVVVLVVWALGATLVAARCFRRRLYP